MEINKYSKYEKKLSQEVNFFKGTREMMKMLGKGRFLFFLGVFIVLLSSFPVIISPFYVRNITENIGNNEVVIYNCIILASLYAAHPLLQYLGSVILGVVTERLTLELRERIFDKVLKMPFSVLIDKNVGQVISLVSYDIDTINTSITNNIITIFSNFVALVGSLVAAIIISPLLSIFLLLPFVLSLGRTIYISKIMRRKYYEKSKELSEYETELHEWVHAKTTIDSYNLNASFVDKLEKENSKYHKMALDAEKSGSSISPFSHLIQHSCLVVISIVALLLLDRGIVDIAIYSAFILYSKKFSEPIGDISTAFSEFSNSLASFAHISKFLSEKYEVVEEGNTEISGVDVIASKNLYFSYDKKIDVLKDITCSSINKGTVALVGHTGCGKTTLISLYLSLFTDYRGDISVNKVNYKEVNKKTLRKELSYISQDPWIFKGTVLDNLTYGMDSFDIEYVKEICKEIGLDIAINNLPNKYDEVISIDTHKLSMGQLQMISVARAIAQNREFLIMDEPTSNMDFLSELRIKNAINKFRNNKSTIIIAHRLSTIYSSDLIVVMDNGEIVESGTHKFLLNKKGLYYKMFSSHFVTEE